MIKQKYKNIKFKYTSIMFIVVGILCILFCYIELYSKLEKKQYYTYTEISQEYYDKVIEKDTISSNIIPKTSALNGYAIPYKSTNYILGSIKFEIFNNNNEEIYNKEYNFRDVVTDENLFFDLSDIELIKNQKYKFNLVFNLDNSIIVNVDENNNIENKQILGFENKGVLKIIISIITLGFISLVVIFGLNNNMEIEKICVVLVLISGLCTIILLPPFTAPDEARHFYRAYDIAQGNIITDEFDGELGISVANIPKEISQLKYIGIEKNESMYVEHSSPIILDSLIDEFVRKIEGETETVSLNATSIINPIAYLPQVIFIKIGMLLKVSPLIILYLSRLGNLIVWALSVYMSIKLIPQFKWIFTVIALMPSMVILGSSCSTDSLLIASILLLISYIFYIKSKKSTLYTKKNIAILILLTILISAIKLPYIIFLLLILIIDKPRNWGLKEVLCIIGMLAVGIITYKIWSILGVRELPNEGSGIPTTNNIKEYIVFVINNPFEFIQLIISNLRQEIIPYIIQIFSGSAWNYSSDSLLAIINFVMFIIVSVKSSNLLIINEKYEKIIFLNIIGILYLSICFALFTAKPINFGSLWGMQGRYIIPIIPIIGIILSSNRNNYEESNSMKYIPILLIISSIVFIFNLINCNFMV